MFCSDVFTENLCKLRKRHGMSQSQVAEHLHLTTQAVSKWERGESLPDLDNLCRLSELFGVSLDMLVGNHPQEEKTLIAIDGGGTKTEFVLITQQGMLLKHLVLPGSNPNTYGMETACGTLKEGIETLMRAGTQVMGIFLGGSGMGTGNHAQTAEAFLRAAYPKVHIRCKTDVSNLFACSSDPENSIAVICGTGSVVYAKSQGEMLRAGGGGSLLERQGSGYDMGREAILAAMEHRDGTGPQTCLTEAVEKKLGDRVWQCIQQLYRKEPAYIASFAPLVLEAWEKQDPVATRIVEENCGRLVHLITVVSQKAPNARHVILSGSVLTKSEAFRNRLLEQLEPGLTVQMLEKPQIWGACLQCAELCGLPRPSETLFLSQYKN